MLATGLVARIMTILVVVLSVRALGTSGAIPERATTHAAVEIRPGADCDTTRFVQWDEGAQGVRLEIMPGARLLVEEALLVVFVRDVEHAALGLGAGVPREAVAVRIDASVEGEPLGAVDASSGALDLGPRRAGEVVALGLSVQGDARLSAGQVVVFDVVVATS